jgi:hypothetical protein
VVETKSYSRDCEGRSIADEGTGRFLKHDPARDGVSWYGYCGGNPLLLIDPSGLDPHQNGGQPYKDGTYTNNEYQSIQDKINAEQVSKGASVYGLGDLIKTTIPAESFQSWEGIWSLDPATRGYVQSLEQSELVSVLNQITVYTSADKNMIDNVFKQLSVPQYSSDVDMHSIGMSIYVYDKVGPDNLKPWAAELLCHEAVHALQFLARGGFNGIMSAYRTDMDTLESSAYKFAGSSIEYPLSGVNPLLSGRGREMKR